MENRLKKHFFLICFLTYVGAYLCRINFSAALFKIQAGLPATEAQLGRAGSIFFICYAVGQLMSGWIGDRVSPYRFVSFSIFGTVLLNTCISFCTSITAITILWGINGVFQSMFWGPMIRALSQMYPPEENAKISAGMNYTMTIGYLLTWTVFGQMFALESWTVHFFVPALLTATLLPVWLILSWQEKKAPPQKALVKAPPLSLFWSTFRENKLALVAGVCVCEGLVRESVNLWAPYLFVRAFHIEINQSPLFLAILPLGNLLGIILTKRLLKKKGPGLVLGILFSGGAVAAVAILLAPPLLAPLFLAALSMMMSGGTVVLLAFLPLSFGKKGIVSSLVGVFDFCTYLGAAVSSFVLGILLTTDRFSVAAGIWAGACALAIGFALLYHVLQKKKEEEDGAKQLC